MVRELAFAMALAIATAFAAPALAFDLFDFFDEKGGSQSRSSETPLRHRDGASREAGQRPKEARSPQQRHYHWPDARYYGRHGMVLD